MSSASPVRKFNPGVLQSDEDVVAQFVVRQREFGILMDVLRGNIASSPCQHMLVVAPRGRGKTMMLARVAAELRSNEVLRREFLPVRFMEESYEVFDLADFWLDVLLYLAPEVACHDAEAADQLRQAHAEFSRRPPGAEVEESARTVALETARRLGRKLVLMVENCQSLFDDVDDRFGWGLRKTLQTEPNVMFLGTATVRMAALTDVEAPFYEFFRTLLLAPLPLSECRVLWEAVSGETRSEREIRPLQILTGGDPRLLVIVAGLSRHRSLRELLQELVALVDDHTEYFRSHLDQLSKTERRVYVALIDLWRPSTTAEIAARARQDVRATSSLLGRLVKRGAISYEGKGQKRLYQATQPLYSIYYKLRRQRDEAAVVHGLVHWMVACFTTDELSAMEDNLVQEAAQSASIREGLRSAFRALPAVRTTFPSAARLVDFDEVCKLMNAANGHVACDPRAAIEPCEQAVRVLDRYLNDDSPEGAQFNAARAQALEIKAGLLALIESEEALLGEILLEGSEAWARSAGFRQVKRALITLAAFAQRVDTAKPETGGKAARAIALKAELEVQLRRPNDALATIDELVRSFATSADSKELQWAEWIRARALLIQGEREAALEALEAAYKKTTLDEQAPIRLMHHVPELIGCGLAAQDLLTIFTKDSKKRFGMATMIVVLRLCNNETVREPAEVLATAQELARLVDQSVAQVRSRRSTVSEVS